MIGWNSSRRGELIYFLLVFGYCLLFCLQDYIHLQDYAQWVYSGVILKAKIQGISLDAFSLRPYPVPNALVTVCIAALSFIVNPLTAAKAVIVIYLSSFSWIVLSVIRRISPYQYIPKSLLVLTTMIVSSSFWNGYMNYQIALLLFAWFYLFRMRQRDSATVTALFGVLIFFSHAVVYAVFFIYVCFVHVDLKRINHRVFALIPSALLTLWYLYATYLGSGRGDEIALASPIGKGVINFALYKGYTFLKAGPFQNYILSDGSSFLERFAALYYGGILISGFFLVAILWIMAQAFYKRFKKDIPPDRDLAFFAVIFVSFIFFPAKMLQVVNIGERFMVVGLLFLLFRLDFQRHVLILLSIAAILFTGYNMVFLSVVDRIDISDGQTATVETVGSDRLSEEFQSLYRGTRFKYFNHRLYEGMDHYRTIENGTFSKGVFPTGIFRYNPPAN